MQGKSYEEIARIVSASTDYNVSAKECENAYKRFMGVKVQTESGRNFEMLLLKTKKLHLYGGIGVFVLSGPLSLLNTASGSIIIVSLKRKIPGRQMRK